MKFLCDVHISYKLKNFLITQAHTAIHVNELPEKSETKDNAICDYCDSEGCILITKDFDFVDFYFLKQTPKKVIKISLGNIANNELLQIFSEILPFIEKLVSRDKFLVEINKDGTYSIHQTESK